MRLCEHLRAFSQGWPFKVLPGKARVSRSGTARHPGPRFTAPHASRMRSGVMAVQKFSAGRGNGACSMRMLYIILISFFHNHTASHIVKA